MSHARHDALRTPLVTLLTGITGVKGDPNVTKNGTPYVSADRAISDGNLPNLVVWIASDPIVEESKDQSQEHETQISIGIIGETIVEVEDIALAVEQLMQPAAVAGVSLELDRTELQDSDAETSRQFFTARLTYTARWHSDGSSPTAAI